MMKNGLDPSKLSIASSSSLALPSEHHLLLLDKPEGGTSFNLVAQVRRASRIQKIGHAGTLDPFATGVMLLLVGKSYTQMSNLFLNQDKEYLATVHLGISTDTYDCKGVTVATSSLIPTLTQIEEAIAFFQGTIAQIPPMFSAKKQQGKKLYELARKGIEVERAPVEITLATELLSYAYPEVKIKVSCSKGTYIRGIAHDLGVMLKTGAHLSTLTRTRVGTFYLADCLSLENALSLYEQKTARCASCIA